MDARWAAEAAVYHLYPLGLCGAPPRNLGDVSAGRRLGRLEAWIPHAKALGFDTLLLGPVWESLSHGYDTVDYFRLDRRLGENGDLKAFVRAAHEAGLRVLLDTVFNHSGKEFFAFRELRKYGPSSEWAAWYAGVGPGRAHGEGFTYETWAGFGDLPKYRHGHGPLRDHLLSALEFWIREFEIDGLRLDAADVLPKDFLAEVCARGRLLKPDLWIVGEIVHGDYRGLADSDRANGVTNYEAYKGLWSSFKDKNMFEIAYALKRQSGPQGIYRGIDLYNFADNHDVNRVSENLDSAVQLYPLYGLLFTMPGIPSLYYGSEWGRGGKKGGNDDWNLRPALGDPGTKPGPEPALEEAIRRLAFLRKQERLLRHGAYEEVAVEPTALVFARFDADRPADCLLVCVQAGEGRELSVALPRFLDVASVWEDVLNGGIVRRGGDGKLRGPAYSNWLRVFRPR